MIEPLELMKSSENLEMSDPCLMLTDSSCEETLVESSSEDNMTGETSKSTEPPLSTSSYVKNMLADAMCEKSESGHVESDRHSDDPREHSPVSSERFYFLLILLFRYKISFCE